MGRPWAVGDRVWRHFPPNRPVLARVNRLAVLSTGELAGLYVTYYDDEHKKEIPALVEACELIVPVETRPCAYAVKGWQR